MTWEHDHCDRMEGKWKDAEAKVKELEAENKKLKEQLIKKSDGYLSKCEIDLLKTKKIYALEEENKKLKTQNEFLWEPVNADDYIRLQKQYDELKEQLESLQVAHIDMKCEITGLSLTEDDLYMSLDVGRLICESAYDDLDDDDKKTRKELQEKITCLESDSMNEVSQAEFDDMVQEKDEEIKQMKKKCMKSVSKLAREKKNIIKQLTELKIIFDED